MGTQNTHSNKMKSNNAPFNEMDSFSKKIILSYQQTNKMFDISQKIEDSNYDTTKKLFLNDSGEFSSIPFLNENASSNRSISYNVAFLDTLSRDIGYLINSANWQSTKALINGIDLDLRVEDKNSDDSKIKERITDVQQYLSENLFQSQKKILYLGYFHGGSAGLIVIKDEMSEKILRKPLNIDSINKGDFQGIMPLTRLYQIEPYYAGGMVLELGKKSGVYDPDMLGKPMYYRVSFNGSLFKTNNDNDSSDSLKQNKTYIVHVSRLLIYNGSELSWIESQLSMFWGVSAVERAWDSISKYEALLTYINQLAQRSNIPVIKMGGMDSATLYNKDNYIKLFESKIGTIVYSIESGGVILLSADEGDDLKFETANFSDLPALLLEYKKNLATDLQSPLSVAFSDKANDENGDDEKSCFWIIESLQNKFLRSWYQYTLVPIVYKHLTGEKIPEFTFTFKSLVRETEKEKAEKMEIVAKILEILYNCNIISSKDANTILENASDNISDMFHHLSKEYKNYLETGDFDVNIMNKYNYEKHLAIELQTAQLKAQAEFGNKEYAKLKGKEIKQTAKQGGDQGGNPKNTKKVGVDIPIVNKKE